MKKITVLGAGMVGSAIALDLAFSHAVTAVDRDRANLELLKSKNPAVETMQADVTQTDALQDAAAGADLLISAVPGHMGFEILKNLIGFKKPIVDISFFPEDAFQLDSVARQNGVTAIVDCGVAPGMDNIILGHYDAIWKVTNFECYVGGLPVERKWPFEYKAPFSPADVIEEYLRPARLKQNGEIVTREALSDPELMDFGKAGMLEAFNTDGLRSLLKTMRHIPDMKEKTLRYPHHIEYIRVLRESGFFSGDLIDAAGTKVRPIDLTSALLFHQWKLRPGDREFTAMRVIVEGSDAGQSKRAIYNLHDETDVKTGTSSMARTTGYTATAAAEFMLRGNVNMQGIIAPEILGRIEGCLGFFLAYQEKRGIRYERTVG